MMIRQYLTAWKAFLIGGMAGAVVMWLIAPMSGQETRRILRENVAEAQIKANLAMEDAQEKANRLSNIGRRVVEEQKSVVERGANEAKDVLKGSHSSGESY
jgi:gas vesicle protein